MESQKSRLVPFAVGGFAALLAISLLIAMRQQSTQGKTQSTQTGLVKSTVNKGSGSSVFPDQAVLRPLPVSVSRNHHEWTSGNAKEPAVIERIAHNPDEAIRMIEENDRIHRRQLVYRKETAATVVQRARSIGEPVSHLTLPGLDGRELEFEVARADIDPSGNSGSFAGRLAGQPDSMVILSFRGGREAFSVSAPSENLHLQADPREPGEVIVKHIDPATYIKGHCGNPDHQH